MHKLKLAYNTPDPSDSNSFYEDPRYSEPYFDPDRLKVRKDYGGKGRLLEYGDNEIAWIGRPQPEDVSEYNLREPNALQTTYAFISLDPQWAFALSEKAPFELTDKEILNLFESKLVDLDGEPLDMGEWILDNFVLED